MKRSAWLRIIAVILIISMVAAPVSAAGAKGSTGTRNHLIGNIADMIRDLFRDRFGGSFGQPGEEPTTPSNPVDPTTPTEPGETEPEVSEPEISLELIEGHANVENGHLLRGVTYSLTELPTAQSNPPFSLRNNGFGATSLGGNAAGSLSLGRTPLNAMAEGDASSTVDIALEVGATHTINVNGDVSGDYSNDIVNVNTEFATTTTKTANLANHTTGLSNGNYLLVSANQLYRVNAGTKAVRTTLNSDSKLPCTNFDLSNIPADAIWTLEVGEPASNGSMTGKIMTPDGKCLAYDGSKVTLADDTTVTIIRGTSTDFGDNLANTWGVNFSGNDYLNYGNPVARWSFDNGSHWCFYEVTEETITGTTITFTGASVGTTTVEIGGVTYNITVTMSPSDSSRDIPVSVLTATDGNHEDSSATEGGAALALDGNQNTMWHTEWDGSDRSLHWIQFQLNADYKVDGLRYQPRQDSSVNGLVTGYEIQISDDGQTFTPVATGTWSDSNRNWKIATFDAVNTKYVRLVVKNARSDKAALFASAAEIRLTGEEIETIPVEPEQPAIGSELVYFPVTMFNYNNGTTLLNDDSIMRNLTHQAEFEAGLKENWEGLYFSGGTPDPTRYTYTTEAASHSDLSWQQVMDGTYYADEACTEQVAVNTIGDASSEYTLTTVAVGDIWNSRGNEVNVADVNAFETNYYCLYNNNYYHVYIRNSGYSYYVQYLRNGILYGAGNNGGYVFGISDTLSLYENNASVTGYTLVAGGNTLATLDGTDLTTKVGVTLYTAAGEVTVEKDYAEWNFWAYKTSGNAAQNKFYAGLVQDELVDGELKFNVVEPGIFTFDASDPTITNDGIKDIYQNVGLPFIKNEKGYYTFKSDAHGTYFADTNNDNKSDPWYGAEDDYFNMYFDYNQTQGWSGMDYGDGSTNLWAPFNTNANDTAEGNIDYHFGMRADIPFSMTPNGCIKSNDDNSEHITFTFQGDDDVWIFIDGHLVIDLGGIHNRLGATIDFADNTITYFQPESNPSTPEFGAFNIENFELVQKLYNDANGEGALGQTRTDFSTVVDHEMTIFYLERGKGTSNCQIEFNLPMLDTVMVTKDITHSWSALQDERDGENGDGTALLTAKEQAAVDKLDFDFKLWKKEIGGRYTAVANTNYYLLDKDDNVLGIYTTDADGIFSLKNGQTAMFLTDLGNGTITYAVEELNLDLDTFLTPDYKFAGLTTNGFDFYGETLNTETPDENDTKRVDKHLTGNASEIGEQELPMDAVQLVSYDVTPYGSIEAIESLEFICTNYLNADLPSPSARAYEDIIVIDYGLPVQIDPLANDLFRGENIEIVAWGDESLELNEVLQDNQIYAVPYGDEGGTTWNGNELTNVPAAQLGSNSSFSGDIIDVADCLFTFTMNADGTWVVSSSDSNGNAVYLQPYASTNGYPVVSQSQNVTIDDGFTDGAVTLSNTSGYLFFWRDGKNYYDRVDRTNGFESGVSFHLYAKHEDGTYAPIEGKDAIVSGNKYLIVADAGSHGKFITYPTTSNANGKYTQVAKLTSLDNSYLFDSGNVTFNDVTYAETVNADGTVTFTRDSFEYELTKQMTEVEEIRYIIKVNSTVEEDIGDETVTKTACRYALGKIYIVPATIMYYEENFSDMITFEGDGWDTSFTVSNQNNVSDFQEPGVVGTIGDSTYGSDVAYLSDNGDSNGTYRFGDTTNKAIRFTYTFTGTGTSIFARTSDKTGYIQVKIYEGDTATGDYMDVYYRDTYWKDTNGVDEDGNDANNTLYNIPVYTNEDLDYGTYTVVCTVAKKGTPTDGNMDGAGNEFYLDGIRVMQPLNQDADVELVEKALEAYDDDGEANLDVVTLRQKLITDNYFPIDPEENPGVEEEEWPFVVLTDIDGEIIYASDYVSIGPKEEVYLAPGQKVSFSLKYWEPEGLKLYMGMKAPFGNASVNVGHNNYELNNAADCYYDVTSNYESLVPEEEQLVTDDGRYVYTDAQGNLVYEEYDEATDSSTFYNENDEVIEVNYEDLTKVMREYYIVTYTFEAANVPNNIVSLTNIKVVGQHEFVIVEKTDIDMP